MPRQMTRSGVKNRPCATPQWGSIAERKQNWFQGPLCRSVSRSVSVCEGGTVAHRNRWRRHDCAVWLHATKYRLTQTTTHCALWNLCSVHMGMQREREAAARRAAASKQ